MDTPDKKQPRKRLFKIPANFYELSEEEQSAWTPRIAKELLREVDEGDTGRLADTVTFDLLAKSNPKKVSRPWADIGPRASGALFL